MAEEAAAFTDICLISCKTFYQSVVLDLESHLIKHISADGSYRLTNAIFGKSK